MKRMLLVLSCLLLCACVLLSSCGTNPEIVDNVEEDTVAVSFKNFKQFLIDTPYEDLEYGYEIFEDSITYEIEYRNSKIELYVYKNFSEAYILQIFISQDTENVEFTLEIVIKNIYKQIISSSSIKGYFKMSEYHENADLTDELYITSYRGDSKEEDVEKSSYFIYDAIKVISIRLLNTKNTGLTFNSIGFIHIDY